MTNYIPEFFDEDGEISSEILDFIEKYQPSEELPLLSFVQNVLRNIWAYHDHVIIHRKYKGQVKVEFHTGGWSDNELIMRSILANINLTHFKMRYVMWKEGGHYYFTIKI